MKKIGIIVEYNPLHNGHLYHFNNIPKNSDDIIIAVMSSSLVNRGEISVFNKFDKTSLALEMGVDLIIELPSIFTIQSGEIFAKRAIEILNYVGVDSIYIGSENNNVDTYESYYKALNSNEYNNYIKEYLKEGYSYKSSSQFAFEKCGLNPLLPNDSLGLFYYKAIKDEGYNICLNTIKRTNDYSDPFLNDSISSATSIRLNQSNIKNQVPSYVYNLYNQKGFLTTDRIFNYLKINIYNLNLSNIFLIDEGFENSLKDIYKYDSYNDFLTSINTKRYSIARISRIMMNILFNIKKDEMDILNKENINFIRILGYSKKGKEYLNSIKHNKKIYTNIKEGINKTFDIELRISKILDTIYNLNLLKFEQKGPIEYK